MTLLSKIALPKTLLPKALLPKTDVLKTDVLKTDMLKALDLTRGGRLSEAMAVLTGGAPAAPAAEPATASPRPPLSSGILDRLGSIAPLAKLQGLSIPGRAHAPMPLPDGARFEERAYSNEAGTRTYKVYSPSRLDGRALPLIVMLHGCTQSPDDFAAGTRMNELAEEFDFIVAYPAQTQSANASRCWNWFVEGDQHRGQGEPSLIAGMTQAVMRDFPVDPARIFVAGLSAGGAEAAIMGVAYPDLYAGIGVHSGLACGDARDMPSAFAAMRQGGPAAAHRSRGTGQRLVPTIVFHGDRDGTVNAVNGDRVIAQAGAGADLLHAISHGTSPGGVAYTRKVQSDADGRPVLEQWTLHGAGHAWAGGSPAGSYTDPHGPDASREMVRFFLDQPARSVGPATSS